MQISETSGPVGRSRVIAIPRRIDRRTCVLMLVITLGIGLWTTTSAAEKPETNGSAKKLSVPSPEQLEAAEKRVRDIFATELANLKTSAARIDLVNVWFTNAEETKDDPAGRYALLMMARDLAAEAGQTPLIDEAVDRAAAAFDVDPLRLKAIGYQAAAKQPLETGEHFQLLQAMLNLMDQAEAADRFEIALPLGDLALASARKIRDKELSLFVNARLAKLKATEKEYREAIVAVDVLKQAPTDATANYKVGKYLCLAKGDWERGLPRLALGYDPTLAAAARLDLSQPNLPVDQVKVGDAWFDSSETLAGSAQANVLKRAGYWYSKAIPAITGLAKGRLEKRLSDISEATKSAPSTAASFNVVLAEDKHLGTSGTVLRNHIYTLNNASYQTLNKTILRYQAKGARNDDSTGEISLSIDGRNWTRVGGWNPRMLQAAHAQQDWHTLNLSTLPDQVRADRMLVKFEYKAGREMLVIQAVVWTFPEP